MRNNLRNFLFVILFSTIFWGLIAYSIFVTLNSEIPGVQYLPNIIEKLNYTHSWPILFVLLTGYILTMFAGVLILYEKEFWRYFQ